MTAGRKKRTQYDFTIGPALEAKDEHWLVLQASAQISLARMALKEADRSRALGRLEAADECLAVLARKTAQLRL